jgi:hypothetical protein
MTTEPHSAAELLDVLDNLAALHGGHDHNAERAPDPRTRAVWLLDQTLFQQAYRKDQMHG